MAEYVEHTYEDVYSRFSQYIHNPQDIAFIKKAYDYAKEKHNGQFRKSGQPYIIHLIEVAYLVTTLQGGPVTIVAAFLHDTIEDCGVLEEDIEKEFGKEVAEIVFSLTKIKALSHQRRHDKEFVADGHRKILLGMAKDIRVIIIKLCDRLHNMRTLDFQTPEKKISISQETLDVYCPIADRLGLNEIKGELQDLCLKYLHPEAYNEIMEYLNTKIKYKEDSILKLKKKIADLLLKTNIPFEILARVKRPYSIWKKLNNNHTFDTIYDIVALRVITQSELNCYEILGLIHSEYSPLPGRFKDYIAVPKPNMYRSLHTTIIDHDSTIIEIQIRTKEMDEVDESGVAAHWRYKEGSKYDPKKEQKEIMEKLHWFSDFIQISAQNDVSSKEYMENLSNDVFGANIYCFTPHGKVIDLPVGSTPLDFAFKIHSKIGEHALGAKVNNMLVPLSTKLQTGDVVEIKTSNASNINEGWLKIVASSGAKNYIKKYLTKKNAEFLKETQIEKGKESLIEIFRENNIPENKMMTYLNSELLKHYNVEDENGLFLNVYNKTINPSDVIDYLGLKNETHLETYIKKNTTNKKGNFSSQSVLVKGTPNILCTLSSCCSPLPGDKIVGYVSQGKGIKVHRVDCPNIINNSSRLIDVEWNKDCQETIVPSQIRVKALDRENLVVDILNLMSQMKVPCSKIVAKQHPESLSTTVEMTLQIKNIEQYNDVKNSLINIASVYEVERVIH